MRIRSLSLVPDLLHLAEARLFIREGAEEARFSDSRVFDVTVASSEAIANAIEHASGKGEIQVDTSLFPDRLEVSVRGTGEFEIPDSSGHREHRGLGLPLMAKFSDHLALYSAPQGGTLLTLTFYREGYDRSAHTSPLPPSLLELFESSERLESTFEAMADGFAIFDSDWRCVYANSAIAAYSGKPRGELIGTVVSASELTGSQGLPLLAESKIKGVPVHGELPRTGGDGWIEISAFPFAGGVALFNRDITERKRVQDEIETLSERLSYHMEHSPLAVIEWGPGMRLTRWSKEAERMFGWSAEEVLGKHMDEFRWVHEEDAEHVAEVASQLQGGSDPGRFSSNRNYHKDGSIVYSEWYNSAHMDESGSLKSVLSLVLDVTERKRTEEALNESRARMRMAAVAGRMYGWDADLATGQLELLGGWEELMGLPPARDMDGVMRFYHPADIPLVEAQLKDAIERGGPFTIEHRRIHPLTRELRWFVDTGKVITDEGGRSVRVVGVTQDITERKRREGNEAFLAEISQDLSRAATADEILQLVAAKLAGFLSLSRCHFVDIDDAAGTGTLIHDWHVEGLPDLPDGRPHPVPRFFTEDLHQPTRAGETVVVRDRLVDPRAENEEAGALDVRSYITAPLIKNGRLRFTVTASAEAPRAWREDEIGLVRELAARVWLRLERVRAEEALRQSEARYRVLAAENARLYRQQLEIAEKLQSALLDIPSQLGSVSVGHLYRSATEAAWVGGDFYDVFPAREGKIALLIGDVAGHGIQAARTATLVKDIVHAFIHQSLRTHEVLRRANTLLVEKDLPGFVTLFLGVLDGDTGLLRYSSAGHPDTLLRRASGEVQSLGAVSPPLGVYPDASWKAHEIVLEEDDLLLLYTDGLIEARSEGRLFGEQRLQQLVKDSEAEVDRLPRAILDRVLAFSGGNLRDDVAILALTLMQLPGGRAAQPPFTQETLLG